MPGTVTGRLSASHHPNYMHSPLDKAKAHLLRSPLIALLIACNCILAQVIMADMDERDQRIATLQTWFHVSKPDGPVDEAGLQSFLDEMSEVHFMDAVAADGRAAAVITAGYTSKHDVAGLTVSR